MPLHVYNTAQLRDCTSLDLVPKYHLFGAHSASPVLVEEYTVGDCNVTYRNQTYLVARSTIESLCIRRRE